jgi:TRAP-type mannitol/chloroaromatic compound transport system permease small subunit
VIALTTPGYFYAAESWAINEHSERDADGPPVYPFKTIIPVAGAFLWCRAWWRSSAACFA